MDQRQAFIQAMPKVELHVHLEGSVKPATLLKLAKRHDISLPADSVEGLQDWYSFKNFPHFVEIYFQICDCIRTPEDIELITREFLAGQAAQNIRYSEVTYTPYTHYVQKRLPFSEQLAAINRARTWAEGALGVSMRLIPDIPRNFPVEAGDATAEWAISGMGDGVVAMGLGGTEQGNPPEKFAAAFARTAAAGLPAVPHAGETDGPDSIRGAIDTLQAVRIGHGVRCLEDPALVAELVERQIPLEVCPTSNVCLKVVQDFAAHPLPRLLEAGLYITLNSDDPPMFNTTLTDEYLKAAGAFAFSTAEIETLVMNAVRASLLPDADKTAMIAAFEAEFARLHEGDAGASYKDQAK